MNLYSKEQITRELAKSMEQQQTISSGVQKLVLTLSATMLTLLLPIGYVLTLSFRGRICLFSGVFLLLLCLLAGMAAAFYTVHQATQQTRRLSDYYDNYEEYATQLSGKDQMRKLRGGRGNVPTVLTKIAVDCFVLALSALFALLCQILFP